MKQWKQFVLGLAYYTLLCLKAVAPKVFIHPESFDKSDRARAMILRVLAVRMVSAEAGHGRTQSGSW